MGHFIQGDRKAVHVLQVAELPIGQGYIGLCPIPGRNDQYKADVETLLAWNPALVLSMTTDIEMEAVGADILPGELVQKGITWRHLPITDFGSPCQEVAELWPSVEREAQSILANGGRVLVHCYGGCGRSGMAVLRIMVGAGEDPEKALGRLRAVRPCAVETAAQAAWAMKTHSEPVGQAL